MSLPIPKFFQPQRAGTLYITRKDEIVAEADHYAREHKIPPARGYLKKNAVFLIDPQIGFCHPGESMYVPGAEQDLLRICQFILRHMDKIDKIKVSLDTHYYFQVFFSSMWQNEAGQHPAPFTIITEEDVHNGRWKPVAHIPQLMEYTEKLAATGKYQLMIWPYHTMMGDISHAVDPMLFEVLLFHASLRQYQTHFETKGQHILTENYSVLKPEVTELCGQRVGGFRTEFFDALLSNQRLFIAGQASSHCVKATLEDLIEKIELTDPGLFKKITLLTDCMSPVQPVPGSPDFPAIAHDFMLNRCAPLGMTVCKSSEVVFE